MAPPRVSPPSLPGPCRWLISAAAALVPDDVRHEWRREWLAEVQVSCAATGRSPRATTALVVRCFGAFTHAAWLRADRWRFDMWWYDVRIAARSLLAQPAFCAVAVLTLAVGIGANAAVFSAVYAALLRPLPFPGAERLVAVTTVEARGGGDDSSPPDFVDWRDRASTFEALAAFSAQSYAVSGDAPAEQAAGAFVTGDFFAALGVAPTLGRGLTADDTRTNAAPVVVISDRLWQQRFAQTPDIIGRAARVDGVARTIVGVMPRGVTFPLEADLWLPLGFTDEELRTQRGALYLTVFGRLRRGRVMADAAADLKAIAAGLATAYPRTNHGRTVALVPLRDLVVGDIRPSLVVLLAAAGLVLLVVCVNVAGLVLTRALGRSRELALRAALGAGPARLLRGAMAEACVLAAAGAAVGTALAWAGARRISTLEVATSVPLLAGTRLDGVVLAVTIGLAALTAMAVGAVPAWRASRAAGLAGTGDGGRSTGAVRSRSWLVVAEIALALVLAVGAVTLARGFGRMLAVPRGFDLSEHVMTASLTIPGALYDTPASRAQFVSRALDGVRSLPDVQSAGAVFGLPLTGFGYNISVSSRDGVTLPQTPSDVVIVSVRAASPDYFRSMGIATRRGRDFEAGDAAERPRVVVVNEAAARLLWPDADALGRSLTLGTRLGQDAVRTGGTVVGIVADTREAGAERPPRPTVFVPYAQEPTLFVSLVVRGAGRAPEVAGLRRVLTDLDPAVPMFRVRTTAQLGSALVAQSRLLLVLMALFAAAALLVAALGLYGLLAHAVAARGREIGVRRAIGATAGDIVRLVAAQSAWAIGAGTGLGVLASWMSSSVLVRFVFGATGPDVPAYAAAVALTLAVGGVAAVVPCRRALAIDPAVALKAE